MANATYELRSQELEVLHPRVVRDHALIARILAAAERARVVFRQGMNRKVLPETAVISTIAPDFIEYSADNFTAEDDVLKLRFEVDGLPYFMVVQRVAGAPTGAIRSKVPEVLFQAERRDRSRDAGGQESVQLMQGAEATSARVIDRSPGGLGLLVPSGFVPAVGDVYKISDDGNPQLFGRVQAYSCAEAGWTRLHLSTHAVAPRPPLDVERRTSVRQRSPIERARDGVGVAGAVSALSVKRGMKRLLGRKKAASEILLARYENAQGEEIVGILDGWREEDSPTAILIPPAWGRTKETLMPLARTLVASFRRANEPVVVLRYDGVRRRGESHNDPECLAPGAENHHFTFSQGVRDIDASVDFLYERYRPSRVVLVTFSAASIEGRAWLARSGRGRVDAWICVVGAADMQSMMRVISGGIDYADGFEKGLSFGMQEILGVSVDIDHAARDATVSKLGFLEDSRRDFSVIDVPLTWIHGKHDAWMSLERVQDVLSFGPSEDRRLIEVPTGHQLRSSAEALEVFQFIAEEIGRLTGVSIAGAMPSLSDLESRGGAERKRVKKPGFNRHEFWDRYLVGRSGSGGIELMNRTDEFGAFMDLQVRQLRMRPGQKVLDLGCGAGSFPARLERCGASEVTVFGVDLVRSALRKVQQSVQLNGKLHLVESDLDEVGGLPLADASVDRVIASLFLSYVENPARVLAEVKRVLRPGGRLVLSSMKPDADISRVFVQAFGDAASGKYDKEFSGRSRDEVVSSAQEFINEAAQLMDLEEAGEFVFWDGAALQRLLVQAGFDVDQVTPSFGEPPQAWVVSASAG